MAWPARGQGWGVMRVVTGACILKVQTGADFILKDGMGDGDDDDGSFFFRGCVGICCGVEGMGMGVHCAADTYTLDIGSAEKKSMNEYSLFHFGSGFWLFAQVLMHRNVSPLN